MFQLPKNLSLLQKKIHTDCLLYTETIQYSRDVKLHFSM